MQMAIFLRFWYVTLKWIDFYLFKMYCCFTIISTMLLLYCNFLRNILLSFLSRFITFSQDMLFVKLFIKLSKLNFDVYDTCWHLSHNISFLCLVWTIDRLKQELHKRCLHSSSNNYVYFYWQMGHLSFFLLFVFLDMQINFKLIYVNIILYYHIIITCIIFYNTMLIHLISI
jgi:hypothetical protein